MLERNEGLSAAELAGLDLLITVAQGRGRRLTDQVRNTECLAEAQMNNVETRMGGIAFSDRDREILEQIRELAGGLEASPTLGELIELRGQAVRGG